MPLMDSIISGVISSELQEQQRQKKAEEARQKEFEDMVGVAKNLGMMKQVYSDVPTSEGFLSKPRGVWEEVKQLVGMNKPLDVYEGLQGLLGSTLSRQVGGEKGVLTDKDVSRIMSSLPSAFTPGGTGEAQWGAIQSLLENRYGKSFDPYFNPQEPYKIRGY